jgi:hypothetical protein
MAQELKIRERPEAGEEVPTPSPPPAPPPAISSDIPPPSAAPNAVPDSRLRVPSTRIKEEPIGRAAADFLVRVAKARGVSIQFDAPAIKAAQEIRDRLNQLPHTAEDEKTIAELGDLLAGYVKPLVDQLHAQTNLRTVLNIAVQPLIKAPFPDAPLAYVVIDAQHGRVRHRIASANQSPVDPHTEIAPVGLSLFCQPVQQQGDQRPQALGVGFNPFQHTELGAQQDREAWEELHKNAGEMPHPGHGGAHRPHVNAEEAGEIAGAEGLADAAGEEQKYYDEIAEQNKKYYENLEEQTKQHYERLGEDQKLAGERGAEAAETHTRSAEDQDKAVEGAHRYDELRATTLENALVNKLAEVEGLTGVVRSHAQTIAEDPRSSQTLDALTRALQQMGGLMDMGGAANPELALRAAEDRQKMIEEIQEMTAEGRLRAAEKAAETSEAGETREAAERAETTEVTGAVEAREVAGPETFEAANPEYASREEAAGEPAMAEELLAAGEITGDPEIAAGEVALGAEPMREVEAETTGTAEATGEIRREEGAEFVTMEAAEATGAVETPEIAAEAAAGREPVGQEFFQTERQEMREPESEAREVAEPREAAEVEARGAEQTPEVEVREVEARETEGVREIPGAEAREVEVRGAEAQEAPETEVRAATEAGTGEVEPREAEGAREVPEAETAEAAGAVETSAAETTEARGAGREVALEEAAGGEVDHGEPESEQGEAAPISEHYSGEARDEALRSIYEAPELGTGAERLAEREAETARETQREETTAGEETETAGRPEPTAEAEREVETEALRGRAEIGRAEVEAEAPVAEAAVETAEPGTEAARAAETGAEFAEERPERPGTFEPEGIEGQPDSEAGRPHPLREHFEDETRDEARNTLFEAPELGTDTERLAERASEQARDRQAERDEAEESADARQPDEIRRELLQRAAERAGALPQTAVATANVPRESPARPEADRQDIQPIADHFKEEARDRAVEAIVAAPKIETNAEREARAASPATTAETHAAAPAPPRQEAEAAQKQEEGSTLREEIARSRIEEGQPVPPIVAETPPAAKAKPSAPPSTPATEPQIETRSVAPQTVRRTPRHRATPVAKPKPSRRTRTRPPVSAERVKRTAAPPRDMKTHPFALVKPQTKAKTSRPARSPAARVAATKFMAPERETRALKQSPPLARRAKPSSVAVRRKPSQKPPQAVTRSRPPAPVGKMSAPARQPWLAGTHSRPSQTEKRRMRKSSGQRRVPQPKGGLEPKPE